jgi:NAD(P)H dehydrogenase (quinone)
VKRVLVVYCHPSPDSFVAAARDSVLEALGRTDADVRVNDLYADGFDPVVSPAERRAHLDDGVDPSIRSYADDLTWCDAVILVYPTWWAGQPAMLKGWMDRAWVKGVAWDLPDGANRLTPRLKNVKRLVAVTTHGSPKYINMAEGEGGKRTITRSLRMMCHPLARTTWLAIYNIDRCSETKRVEFLNRVGAKVEALAS